MSAKENMPSWEFPEDGSQEMEPSEINQMLDELFMQITQEFPPAKGESYTRTMTTEEFFNLIDLHLPDLISMKDVAISLIRYGYKMRFDKQSHQFSWMIH